MEQNAFDTYVNKAGRKLLCEYVTETIESGFGKGEIVKEGKQSLIIRCPDTHASLHYTYPYVILQKLVLRA